MQGAEHVVTSHEHPVHKQCIADGYEQRCAHFVLFGRPISASVSPSGNQTCVWSEIYDQKNVSSVCHVDQVLIKNVGVSILLTSQTSKKKVITSHYTLSFFFFGSWFVSSFLLPSVLQFSSSSLRLKTHQIFI